MLSFVLLFAALDISYSAPVVAHNHAEPINPLTFFGRELPQCMDIHWRFRTKYQIIWGCLLTIFACTWVAVHPNVPNQRHPGSLRFAARVYIVVSALFAPEFFTMWAMRQFIGARKHRDRYNEKFFPELKPKSTCESFMEWLRGPEDDRTDGRWTLTHGFLLEMNGIKVDDGILYDVHSLTKPIEIPEGQINDKSKGDFLTKLFAVLQTAWFIAQCIARWIVHLPVTELEVITLSFAFLSIITYAFWWYKPQSMFIPIMVRKDDEIEFRQIWRKPVEVEAAEKQDPQSGDPQSVEEERVEEDWSQLSGNPQPVEAIEDADDGPQSTGTNPTQPDKAKSWWQSSLIVILILTGIIIGIPVIICAFVGLPLLLMLLKEPSVLPLYSSQDTVGSWKTMTTICGVSTVFAGLHLIPLWTTSFPSTVERLLWKICSISLNVITLYFYFVGCIHRYFNFDNFPLLQPRSQHWHEFPTSIVILDYSLIVTGIAYVAARYILLCVAFTTLRDIPQGAYQNVVWTDLVPHF